MLIWIFGVLCGLIAGGTLMLWIWHVDTQNARRFRDITETGGCPAFRGSDD